MIPPGAFFYLHETAICANRAASGCLLLAVELPAAYCGNFRRQVSCPLISLIFPGNRSAPEVAAELERAGAMYIDEALVIDGQFITARKPGDLHRHLHGVLEYIRGALPEEERAQRRASAW